MITRLWSARTTPQLSSAYLEYFEQHILPELRAVPGYVSAQVLTSSIGPTAKEAGATHVEILVLTVWQSLDAITAFAGPDCESAVVHPAAAALLIDYDRRVRHFAAALSDPSKWFLPTRFVEHSAYFFRFYP
jgi:heme-degrading monooxygenase HmoA